MYDGDQMTPQQAYTHYTQLLMLNSAGIVAVTVAECEKQELPVIPDPVPFPEHVLVDFRAHSNSDIKTKSKHLTQAARIRGWQHKA